MRQPFVEFPSTAHSGFGLLMRGDGDRPQGFGNVMQSFDAAAYRGQRVRFRAAVRVDQAGTRA